MAAYNPPTKVIVIGAGIAGPVLATFLKLNGYHPVIYERVSGPTDGGLAHVYDLIISTIFQEPY